LFGASDYAICNKFGYVHQPIDEDTGGFPIYKRGHAYPG
jgi:hypothetical protein